MALGPMENPLINIDHVTCRFGERTALNNLTFTASEKRIGVVGRNGSGKSTLARVLSGLIAPNEGKAVIAGVDVLNDRKDAIASVGILFQNPDHQIIFPTVIEELSFGLRQMGRDANTANRMAEEMLAKFDRSQWAPRSVSTLSQGQRHLVCLMAVLAMEPKVIILDEPFSGLDIPTVRALEKYLNQLDQTLIHITHEPRHIAHYDRVLWIERGELRGDGTPASLMPEYISAMEADDADALR